MYTQYICMYVHTFVCTTHASTLDNRELAITYRESGIEFQYREIPAEIGTPGNTDYILYRYGQSQCFFNSDFTQNCLTVCFFLLWILFFKSALFGASVLYNRILQRIITTSSSRPFFVGYI